MCDFSATYKWAEAEQWRNYQIAQASKKAPQFPGAPVCFALA
jgi:hypothetical protein